MFVVVSVFEVEKKIINGIAIAVQNNAAKDRPPSTDTRQLQFVADDPTASLLFLEIIRTLLYDSVRRASRITYRLSRSFFLSCSIDVVEGDGGEFIGTTRI